jgi:DNA-binding MarR family transcriptional regulator
MTRLTTPIELATYERLSDVGALLMHRSDMQMRSASGFTGIQYEILLRLRNAGGQLRMSELAGKLTRTPSGLTYQLRQLEERGLANRVRATDDERGVLARITDEGRQWIRDQRPAVAEFIQASVVAPLSAAEIETLHELLGKLQIALRGETSGGITPELAELIPRNDVGDAVVEEDASVRASRGSAAAKQVSA